MKVAGLVCHVRGAGSQGGTLSERMAGWSRHYRSDETVLLTIDAWKSVSGQWQFYSSKMWSGGTLDERPLHGVHYWHFPSSKGIWNHVKVKFATNGTYMLDLDAAVYIDGVQEHEVTKDSEGTCAFSS